MGFSAVHQKSNAFPYVFASVVGGWGWDGCPVSVCFPIGKIPMSILMQIPIRIPIRIEFQYRILPVRILPNTPIHPPQRRKHKETQYLFGEQLKNSVKQLKN